MNQLRTDLDELQDAVITKKDLKAALDLLSEVLGAASVAYLGYILFTAWIPGIGIPISGTAALFYLKKLMEGYADLPADQRRAVALIARKLHSLGLY